MSGSTTNLDLISSSQASKEVTANALFDAESPAALYGRRASTTANLTWGYYGGAMSVNGVVTAIPNGTKTLTNGATNYLEADPTTGNVSVNTSNFTAANIPLYSVVTAGNVVTSYTDYRVGPGFFADKGGSGSQAFMVGTASQGNHAIPLSQTVGKNLIINPTFVINQRAYVSGANLSAGSFGHDRWKAGASGGTYTFTQSANATQITIASGKSLIQVIEDKNVQGTTYTLSWTGNAQARYATNSNTPAGNYASSPITITGQTPGTIMSVEFGPGTLKSPQLEAGLIATQLEFRPIQLETSLCQRYYWRSPPAANFTVIGYGYVLSPISTVGIFVKMPETMRTSPTPGFSTLRVYNGQPAAVTSISSDFSSPDALSIEVVTANSSSSTSTFGYLQNNGSTSAYIDASAEL